VGIGVAWAIGLGAAAAVGHGHQLPGPASANLTARTAAAAGCPPSDEQKWTFDEGFHPFRIWYPKDAAKAEEAKVKYLKSQMDNKIWPMLTGLMHTTPHSKPLDICLVRRIGDGALGNTQGKGGCDGVPAHIEMLSSLGDVDSRDVLAHEFMHSLQYSLNVRCEGTWWWRESTGEWAEDYVYPEDNREHGFAHNYFSDMDRPLPDACDCNKNREYGSYVFPFFIARSLRPSLISAIWHKAENEPLLSAFDTDLPGGWQKQWPRFVLDSWNAKPVDYFKQWDGLKDGVAAQTENDVTTLKPGQVGDLDVSSLPHLSARYFSYKLAPTTRTVTFVNATAYADGSNPDTHVDAILEINGEKKVENWTGKDGMAFCLDHADEHLESLTLIFSNASPSSDMTADPNARHPSAEIAATDAGCTSWRGTIKATWGTDVVNHVTVNVTMLPTFPSNFDNGFNFVGASYVTTGGSLSWSESGTDPDTGCSYSGSDSFAVPSGVSLLVMLWRLDAPPSAFGGYEWLNATVSPWDPTVTEHSSCPNGDGGTTEDSEQIDLGDAVLPTAGSSVYASGYVNRTTIDGSSQNDIEYGPTSWTWHLTSPG
jgi:hypothetical protein